MLPFISGFKKYKYTYKKTKMSFSFYFVLLRSKILEIIIIIIIVIYWHCTVQFSHHFMVIIVFDSHNSTGYIGQVIVIYLWLKRNPQPPTPAQGWQKVEEKKESGLRRIMTSLLVFNPGFLCPNNCLLGRILKPFLYSHSYPQRLLPFLPLKLVGLRI